MYKNYFVNEFQEGLIKKGVCIHYADFITSVLNSVDVECKNVGGKSELGHEWNAVKIGQKIYFVDVTREIFIRDRYGNIPQTQKGKWNIVTLEDMFKMQPEREIDSIGDIELEKSLKRHFYQLSHINQK